MSSRDCEIPDDCHYALSDEWVRMDDGRAIVGITDYAQSELSDIVFIEFPEVGSSVEAGQAFGVVESVKAVTDIFAPVSGEIAEIHEALADHPEWVNEEPYGRGWIVALIPADSDDLETLLSADGYTKHVEERSAR
jgi:glycine cleavage system H protein